MVRMISLEHVVQALALKDFDSVAALRLMAPVPRGWQRREFPPNEAAVMILILSADDGALHTVLTLRTAGLRGHSGQVSFPGGRRDPQDENLTATALRETCEEIGVCGGKLSVLGQFPRFYIPASHHNVSPIIARYEGAPEFAPNPAEVAEVFSVGLEDLLQARFKCVERRQMRGVDVRVPYYYFAGHKVWGATAMLLSELEGRLRQVLPQAALQE
ncbi:MAG: CoA pyrophosphatase [Chloroflexota bacterium]|nr:CoA pyrophosphatase [Chloroflexota bacterium]